MALVRDSAGQGGRAGQGLRGRPSEIASVAEQTSATSEQVSASTQQTNASTQEIAPGASDRAGRLFRAPAAGGAPAG